MNHCAPQHLDAADLLHQAARRDRAGAGDDHLVEQVRRIGEDQEHAARDVAAGLDAEHLDQAERDRRHDDEPGDARRHDEGEQEIGDDEAEQQARIGGADAQHDDVGEPPRDSGLGRDHAEQQRREQEPGGIVGKTRERHR